MTELKPEQFKAVRRIYFVGIKGVGMASLALIAKEAGFEVSGSDVSEEFITDTILKKHNIHIDEGFSKDALKEFILDRTNETMVITTAAHEGLQNPQCKYALENGISVLTHGQAVGLFMNGAIFNRDFQGISILGCHGKTTITAMVATALKSANLDPTYTVGTSEIFPLEDGGHFGKGKYFVAEADEFISDVKLDRTVKFFYQNPDFAIINNIDFDHPDIYKDLNEVKQKFLEFCLNNIKPNGKLIINGDDSNSQFLLEELENSTKRQDIVIITYGEKETNTVRLLNFAEKGWGSEFEVIVKGKSLGIFTLSVPGLYNAKNSLSVISLMLNLGIEPRLIKEGIFKFLGTKRRQEKIGISKGGALVIDDYAHHPDEIKKTLSAIKKAFPEKKILCLFQPHTLSRTQSLWKEFSQSFKDADNVLFLPIFTSKREGETNYQELYDTIKGGMQEDGVNVEFLKDSREGLELSSPPYFFKKNRLPVVEYIHPIFDNNSWVILTLGAGDLYKIGYDLVI